MKGKRLTDYGYVVRGQTAIYSVPISPIAGIANATCTSPCNNQNATSQGDLIDFCKRHKCTCVIAGCIIAYLLLGR